MFIDIVFLIMLVMAIFKGISRGFIVAVFSLAAFVVGLAAALKLSATVAAALQNKFGLSGHWLPILSFLIVFALVVLAVRWIAAIIKKTAGMMLLGWFDMLAGILLYTIIYTMILSVLLFYSDKAGLIPEDVKTASKTFNFVEPFAPWIIGTIGKVLPFLKNVFADLTRFFEGMTLQ